MNELEYGTIFEKGDPHPFGEYFTGQSYLALLTQLEGVGVANVIFEPACRNNWHIHQGDKGDVRFESPAMRQSRWKVWRLKQKMFRLPKIQLQHGLMILALREKALEQQMEK